MKQLEKQPGADRPRIRLVQHAGVVRQHAVLDQRRDEPFDGLAHDPMRRRKALPRRERRPAVRDGHRLDAGLDRPVRAGAVRVILLVECLPRCASYAQRPKTPMMCNGYVARLKAEIAVLEVETPGAVFRVGGGGFEEHRQARRYNLGPRFLGAPHTDKITTTSP